MGAHTFSFKCIARHYTLCARSNGGFASGRQPLHPMHLCHAQLSVAAVCQLCAGGSQPDQHQCCSDCRSLPLQMELDRAETATQELLTAAEQLQKENTQLSAENEVCKLLWTKGLHVLQARNCTQAREQDTRASSGSMV